MKPWPAVTLLLVAALSTAGCTAPAGSPKTVDSESAQGSSDDPAPGNQSAAFVPTDSLLNVTEFHWAVNETWGDTVLEIVFEGPASECDGHVATSSRNIGAGRSLTTVLEIGHGASWASNGGGSLARVHVGDFDTEGQSAGEGWQSDFQGFGFRASGSKRLTIMARNVEPAPSSMFLDNASLAVSVTCGVGFNVTSAQVGHSLSFLGMEDVGSGVGASVAFVGGAAVQDVRFFESASPRTRVMPDGFGSNAARAVVEHPAGSEEWLWTAAGGPLESFEGGAGRYTATLDYAGAGFHAFWLALFGLDSDLDVLAGLRPESGVVDPFPEPSQGRA